MFVQFCNGITFFHRFVNDLYKNRPSEVTGSCRQKKKQRGIPVAYFFDIINLTHLRFSCKVKVMSN